MSITTVVVTHTCERCKVTTTNNKWHKHPVNPALYWCNRCYFEWLNRTPKRRRYMQDYDRTRRKKSG